jgi:anthranilate phosphoribosyltransferase
MECSLNQAIELLKDSTSLTREQCRAVFEQIMTGRVEPGPMGEFLTLLAAKGETVDEIAGAADVMNEKVTRVRCDAPNVIDTCGTGGDGISTFNVSTTAAIIAAAAGAVVAKHGNYTHTRASGSAEAMRELGIPLDASVSTLEACLRECGIAFLFAPQLHPAMKYAGPVRKQLGIRTIFNLLGPLTNPAGARRQVLGVPRPELTETIGEVLAARGAEHCWVVHGEGLCDLTITGTTRVTEVREGRLRAFEVHPSDAGLGVAALEELLVSSPRESAETIQHILSGAERAARRDHAILNAAAALIVAGVCTDLREGVRRAAEAVDTGAAMAKLDHLTRCAHER